MASERQNRGFVITFDNEGLTEVLSTPVWVFPVTRCVPALGFQNKKKEKMEKMVYFKIIPPTSNRMSRLSGDVKPTAPLRGHAGPKEM